MTMSTLPKTPSTKNIPHRGASSSVIECRSFAQSRRNPRTDCNVLYTPQTLTNIILTVGPHMDFIYGRKSLPGALTDSSNRHRNQHQPPSTANKENFKSTKLDTKALKEQLNIINNERKSLTRQSISEITKDLDQTKSRRKLSKVVIERESFPTRKEAILENLVSKLDSE